MGEGGAGFHCVHANVIYLQRRNRIPHPFSSLGGKMKALVFSMEVGVGWGWQGRAGVGGGDGEA